MANSTEPLRSTSRNEAREGHLQGVSRVGELLPEVLARYEIAVVRSSVECAAGRSTVSSPHKASPTRPTPPVITSEPLPTAAICI